MLSKNCLICGNGLNLLGENGGFKIYKCSSCGLGVTEGSMEGDYDQYHRDFVYVKENVQFKNVFARRARLVSKFQKTGRVLEVGSSTGVLLSVLKDKGWEVLGIEPSLEAQQIAVEQGIPTLKTTFERAKLASNRFDVIIFNHVLEHLADPLDVITKANRVLKKDGILFIDVPNFGGLSAFLWGARWLYVLPNEHRWHFTYKALETLLGRTDFKIVHWEATSGVWDYADLWGEIWDSFVHLKKRFFTNVLTLIPTYFITKLNLGTGLTVLARKI
ncbi:MAG: class I SAM-dependent methyltransferase [Candidatus Blackburnbacteria bacterium]|nr:class I SAM-dependent methyltransferase [Candidatus Blackburnbacteria bacterium]